MPVVITKEAYLQDLAERIVASGVLGDRVYRTRSFSPHEDLLSKGIVSVYAPQEEGQRAVAYFPQYQRSITFVIEVSFASSADNWDLLAGTALNEIRSYLLTDGVWLRKWAAAPDNWQVKQFVATEAGLKACGEALTFVVSPGQNDDYGASGPLLKGVDIGIDLIDHFDAVGDPAAVGDKYPAGGPFKSGPEGRNESSVIIES